MRIKNFLFHRVSADAEPWWPPMRPELFDRVIGYLIRTHTVLPLEQAALEPPRRPARLPFATVCFDDGFADNATTAAPILLRHRCPATFFLVTHALSTNTPTWTYRLDVLLHRTTRHELLLPASWVPPAYQRLVLSGPERTARVFAFKRWMKSLSAQQRVELLSAIDQQITDVPTPRVMMSWDDARALQRAGFTLGSHTATHEMLGTTQDLATIDHELVSSAATLTRELGQPPVSVAYPVGSYSPLVIARAQAAGYRLGFAVHQRFFRPGADGPFAIPRVELYQEPWARTWLRTTPAFERLRRWTGR